MTEKRNLLPAFAAALVEEERVSENEGAQAQAHPADSEKTVSTNSRTKAPNQPSIPGEQIGPLQMRWSWEDCASYDDYLANVDKLARQNNWTPEKVAEEKAFYAHLAKQHRKTDAALEIMMAEWNCTARVPSAGL